jgi:predicted enzyme related to lactoylglutathione lyase
MSFLVNIDVDDLEAATRFYCDAFGLQIGRRFANDAIELLGGPAPIYLLHKASGTAPFRGASSQTAGSSLSRVYERHWTPVHLDWVVDDIDAAIAKVEAAGARREGTTEDYSWGRVALFGDPFGHGFCLIELKGRGYDEIATG